MSYNPIPLVETNGMDRKTWLRWRRKGIGGSDAAILYGLYPFGRTVWDLWNDKTGRTPIVDEPFNLTTSIGHALEKVIAQYFTHITGWRTFRDSKMYQHPHYSWMIADLDYMIDFGNGTLGILEDKTTAFFNKADWADGCIPYNYELQCRHYMCVMNIDVVYICCLYDNNPEGFIKRRIERNMLLEAELIAKERDYWNNYVLADVEPEYIEPASVAIASLKKYLSGLKKDKEIILNEKIYGKILSQIAELEEQKKQAADRVKAIEAQIGEQTLIVQKAMGTAKSASCGFYTIGYKQRNTSSCDKDRLLLKYPEVYEEVISTKTSETLQIVSPATSSKPTAIAS